MKSAQILRVNCQCTILRMQLAKAYDTGDEALVLRISREIDEYQKNLWEKERFSEKISV